MPDDDHTPEPEEITGVRPVSDAWRAAHADDPYLSTTTIEEDVLAAEEAYKEWCEAELRLGIGPDQGGLPRVQQSLDRIEGLLARREGTVPGSDHRELARTVLERSDDTDEPQTEETNAQVPVRRIGTKEAAKLLRVRAKSLYQFARVELEAGRQIPAEETGIGTKRKHLRWDPARIVAWWEAREASDHGKEAGS